MGATNALYNDGFQYENPDKPYDLEGFVNSAGAVAGLEYYKELLNRPLFAGDPEVRILGYGKEQMWKQIFIPLPGNR